MQPVTSTLLRHPKGLFFLAITELWERFSYYGMTALLMLYMVNHLLLPGHVENIAGFQSLRSAIESIFGPLSTQALASQIFGLYAGFVYFTPVLGGLVADRWLGQRTAVVVGALAMTAGHLAMAFEQSFLAALLLLVIGSGFLKGNISAQVGALYPPDDETLRSHGFTLFSTGINTGSVFGPILCGYLADRYGWHYGFGIAGIFMLAGLATYLYGYRHLPQRVAKVTTGATPFTQQDRQTTAALIAVMVLILFMMIAYVQIYNVFPLWVQSHVWTQVGTFQIPIAWFSSVDSISCILCTPLLFGLWKWQASRGNEPGDISKIGIGILLSVLANLLLVFASITSGAERVSALWPLAYSATLGVSFMFAWPTFLALISRTAPASINSTMMGLAFMCLFGASNIVGRLAASYQSMGPAIFWGSHAAIAATGALLLLLCARYLNRVLHHNS